MKWTVKRVDESMKSAKMEQRWYVGQHVRIVGYGNVRRTDDGEYVKGVRKVVWQPYAIVVRVTVQQVTVRACTEDFEPEVDAVDQRFCPTQGQRIRNNNIHDYDGHIDTDTWIEEI